MEPASNSCLSYAFKSVKEKKINNLFNGVPQGSELFCFKDRLERSNRIFSAEGIAKVCSDVISKTQSVTGEDASFEIKCALNALQYTTMHGTKVGIDPSIFIQIFKEVTNIDLKVSEDELFVEGIVDHNTFLLHSKLNFTAPAANNPLSSYLYKDKKYVDAKIAVEGRFIEGHRNVLSQCSHFDKQFTGRWKETNTVSLEDFSFDAVEALVKYLYCHYVDKRESEEMRFPYYLELLRLADFVDYAPIKPVIMEKIFKNINKENFIHLATIEFEDPSLDRLFQRCLAKYANDAEIDTSSWSFRSSLSLCLKAKEFGISGTLCQRALKEAGKKLELNSDFIHLCKEIDRLKDSTVKNMLVDAFKENKELYKELRNEDQYKEQWKAFKKIHTDLDY